MLRWRQLALLPRSFGATHGIVATTERSLHGAHSPVAAGRTFLTDSRYSAVTASEFAHHLRAVGVSEETLHEFYMRKENPHLTSSNSGWIARSPQSFPIAVALSGGADSMALMLLLKEFLDAHNVQTPLLAITVDHRLRVESGDEARYVGDIASSRWGVRHVTMECNWEKEDDPRRGRNGTPRKSKLQEEARSFRYERLADACRAHNVKCLFVAHNLGDQLETVLFRLGRASGISGLAGMAAKKDFIPAESGHESVVLLRPLLEVPKPCLKATCERFHQSWVEDPSNESLVFDRIRIRKALECIQESTTGVEDLEALQAFQHIAATAKEEFDAREKELLQSHMLHSEQNYVIVSAAMLSDPRAFDELVIRVLSTLVRQIGAKETPPRLSSLEGLLRDLRALGSCKKVTLSGCCITKMMRGSELHFHPEHTRAVRIRISTGGTKN